MILRIASLCVVEIHLSIVLLVVLPSNVLGARPSIVDAWEPSDADYWGASMKEPDRARPFAVPEFHAENLTRASFDRLVTEGRVFVVRRVGMTHPMRGWDCEFFRKDEVFRGVEVKREYHDPSKPDTSPKWIRLADMPTSGASDSSGSSPYYLGVKDAGSMSPEELQADPHSSVTWDEGLLRKVQRSTITPRFMDPRNFDYLKNTPEFWFSYGVSGGGAKAHVDQHTESTMSLQLAGRKMWRVGPVASRAAPHVMKLYQDGQIYARDEQHTWNILADVVLDPGDAIFFGPGFIHETNGKAGACAASVTWQFNIPQPTTFWRQFLPRLRWTPDLFHTWHILRRIVVRPSADSDGNGVVDSAEMSQASGANYANIASAFLDIDGNGNVETSEVKTIRDLWDALEKQVKKQLPKVLRQHHIGSKTIIEDEDHLRQFQDVVRQAVEKWETEALLEDSKLHKIHEDAASKISNAHHEHEL